MYLKMKKLGGARFTRCLETTKNRKALTVTSVIVIERHNIISFCFHPTYARMLSRKSTLRNG